MTKKQSEKNLKFYAESECCKNAAKRKLIHGAKSVVLDKVIYEWFKQRRSKGVPISGPLLCVKAKEFYTELNISKPYVFSLEWLEKFKVRYGIRHLKASGEKPSAGKEAAEKYVDTLEKLVKEHNLTPEQIYNADETGLYWRAVPRSTLVTAEEHVVAGIKEAKERVTVLVCLNAAGTHKYTLLFVGKSAQPHALRGMLNLPVLYRSNKKAWITGEMTTNWFKHNFCLEARDHCRSVDYVLRHIREYTGET